MTPVNRSSCKKADDWWTTHDVIDKENYVERKVLLRLRTPNVGQSSESGGKSRNQLTANLPRECGTLCSFSGVTLQTWSEDIAVVPKINHQVVRFSPEDVLNTDQSRSKDFGLAWMSDCCQGQYVQRAYIGWLFDSRAYTGQPLGSRDYTGQSSAHVLQTYYTRKLISMNGGVRTEWAWSGCHVYVFTASSDVMTAGHVTRKPLEKKGTFPTTVQPLFATLTETTAKLRSV
ncbi:hypothetical protein Bbelb_333800 [Branchiostoma belcheri]|nr:hypothetical protein Bbelb_333800 [Branchiostoma belcheri]